MKFQNILTLQNNFFQSQQTRDINFRISALKKLQDVMASNEELLFEAIEKDFGKSKFETYTTEISLIKNEINYFIKNIKKLSKPKRVSTNFANWPASSFIYYDSLGTILVIGAWNYPIQLSILPVVSALAAGNTCILKPSELALHTSNALAKIINSNFPKEYFHVIEGGIEETGELLKLNFDKIFFTGSPKVGKIVYEAAAKNLTPVTLELGGKSPVIVTSTANIKVAVKRIAWGKFINAGQTCVAPDYILVDEKIQLEFLDALKLQIKQFSYSKNAEHYTRIINLKNFKRLTSLLSNSKIYYGGEYDEENLYIQPTILYPVDWSEEIMQDEIFGPLLPVISFSTLEDAFAQVKNFEKPLSAYLFSTDKSEMDYFIENISFGGGCINDVVMHLSNHHLPFGGVGNAGIGNYHGDFGFKNFSHEKAILKKQTWGEPNYKYPPYTEKNKNLIKKFI